jgi:ribosomal-protein-alanine N-acetyltransferase
VYSSDARRLSLVSDSIYLPALLTAQIAAGAVSAWRWEDSDEYIIVGYWRRRPEIRTIVEMRCGDHSEQLLAHVLALFRSEQVRMVTLDTLESDRNLHFYLKNGFKKLEELVQYEVSDLPQLGQSIHSPIREMVQNDLDAVLEVDHSAFPWLWHNSLEEFLWYTGLIGVKVFVQEPPPDPLELNVGSKDPHAIHHDYPPSDIIGYAGVTIVGHQGHLDRLAVKSDFQGHGYGETLLAYVLQRMASMGVTTVALSTQADNKRSQELYRKYGFAPTGWVSNIYGLEFSGHRQRRRRSRPSPPTSSPS